jgi:hypothetical protein
MTIVGMRRGRANLMFRCCVLPVAVARAVMCVEDTITGQSLHLNRENSVSSMHKAWFVCHTTACSAMESTVMKLACIFSDVLV